MILSMNVLDLRVFGLPVAQQRARVRIFTSKAGQPIASLYDPAKSRDWKRTVTAQVLPVKPPAPVEGALVLSLDFYFPRPKSLPKREIQHIKRPDLDNCVKAIKDALRGVVYRDDSQIVVLHASKGYGPSPGVQILVRTAELV